MHTQDVFRQCIGHVFRVRGVGTNNTADHVELWVKGGADESNIARADVIWVEPPYVEIVP